MNLTTYLFYAVVVSTVVGLIAMRSTRRHRSPLPVPVAEPTPSGVNKTTLSSMVSEMIFYAYGYRPSDGLAEDFATRLMAESALRRPVNDPSGE